MRTPRGDEILGKVIQMLGKGRVKVKCQDGVTRMGRIPGKMRKRVWIREGDTVIVEPWSFQDEKADIVWRYYSNQVGWLRRNGYLQ